MLSRSSPARILGLALAMAASPTSLGLGPVASAQVPGRDAFSGEPKTPLETWEVANYLIRIGQPAQAAPYLKKFVDAKPDDATILRVRDAFGVGSILGLSDDPETRPYAKPLADLLASASVRNATDPGRLDRAIAGLSKSRPEQDVAVDRLREAGSYAVPPLIQALSVSSLDPSVRSPLAENMGRLDKNAVPALIAALDTPDASLAGDVARALGRIGDNRAIPALTYLAAGKNPASLAAGQAAVAILQLTGREFNSQGRSPVRVLADEARKYHEHALKFPGDPAVLWLWDASAKVPAPVSTPVRDAEGLLGLRFAKEALEVDPTDVDAKVIQLSLGLDHDPAAWKAQALEAGPAILGLVVKRAIADKRGDLAATATALLGQITGRDDLLRRDRSQPLVDALSSPDRRVQFAAAEALVKLDPRGRFAGSSRLVPILARFVPSIDAPEALVIDGNAERASQATGFLRGLGYDARTAPTGALGFTQAAESASIELIAVNPNFINDPWGLPGLLGSLQADPRTSGIPVFLVGPLDLQYQAAASLESFPDAQFLVTPSETRLLKRQLDRGFKKLGASPLSPAERADFARRASGLLAQVAKNPSSPFHADLPTAEPALSIALNGTLAGPEAAEALGDIPGLDAQRSLADVALDPSRAPALRLVAARRLVHHIRRFGAILAPAQERRLVEDLGGESDPALVEAMAAIAGALKPAFDASASRLSPYRPGTP